MENKINIAELLKDCPKCMELDCTMFDNVTFVRVDNNREQFPIEIAVGGLRSKYLTKTGCFHDDTLVPEAKCVIFPKGKTTWEGFVPPYLFKGGDVIFKGNYVTIVSHIESSGRIWYHCWYNTKYKDCKLKNDFGIGDINDGDEVRFATEEEKQKLFDAIKDNGYQWNAETKTLEKLIEPKFKVGDRIKSIHNVFQYDIKELTNTHYTLVEVEDKFKYTAPIIEDKNWELVPNKFDINTLKSFESKVLIRNDENQRWLPAFWGYKVVDGFITTFGWSKYCIPYEGNEHLWKTSNDCDDFYKTWER